MKKHTVQYTFGEVTVFLIIALGATVSAEEPSSAVSLLKALRSHSGEKYEKLLERSLSSMTGDQVRRNKGIFAQWDTKNDWLAQALFLQKTDEVDYEAFKYLLKGRMEKIRKRQWLRIPSQDLWQFLCRYFEKKKVFLWLIEQIVKGNDLTKTEKSKLADWLLGGYWPHKLRIKAMEKLGVSEALMFTVMVDFQRKEYLKKTCQPYYGELAEENDEISKKRRSEFERIRKKLSDSKGKVNKNNGK